MLVFVGALILVIGLTPVCLSLRQRWPAPHPVELVPASAALLFGLTPLVHLAITGEDLSRRLEGTPADIRMAVSSVVLFVAVCAAVAMVVTRWSTDNQRIRSAFHHLGSVGLLRVSMAAGGVWGVRLYLAETYGVFFAGSGSSVEVPYHLTVAAHITQILGAGLIVWSVWTLATYDEKRRLVLAGTLLAMELPYVFSQGRREMFFFAVLCGLIFLYSRSSISWRYVTAAGSGVSLLALAAFPLYQATRVTFAQRGSDGSSVPTYYRTALTAAYRQDVGSLYLSNLESRLSLYYRWQVRTASLRERSGGLDGKLVQAGALYAVPGFAFPEKYDIPWGEEVIRSAYGESARDIPNSLVTAGLADYGLGGVALYASLFVLTVFCIGRIGVSLIRVSPFLGAAFLGSLVLLTLRTEISMVGIFSSVRDLALFGIVVLGWSLVARSFKRQLVR